MSSLFNNSSDFLGHVLTADNFLGRLSGLMGKKNLPENTGLMLFPCCMVHTCFMRFSLDIIFLDRTGTVLHICPDLKPFRFSPYIKNAHSVIEFSSGFCEEKKIRPGDILHIRD